MNEKFTPFTASETNAFEKWEGVVSLFKDGMWFIGIFKSLAPTQKIGMQDHFSLRMAPFCKCTDPSHDPTMPLADPNRGGETVISEMSFRPAEMIHDGGQPFRVKEVMMSLTEGAAESALELVYLTFEGGSAILSRQAKDVVKIYTALTPRKLEPSPRSAPSQSDRRQAI